MIIYRPCIDIESVGKEDTTPFVKALKFYFFHSKP